MIAAAAFARELIGKPFRHRGRGPTHYDCAGVIVHAYARAGVLLRDLAYYGREPARDGLREAVRANFGDPLPIGAMVQPGDVMLMRFNREPHHLAIIGDARKGIGLTMIHSYGEVGRVVEHNIDAMWADRVLEVYRWRA